MASAASYAGDCGLRKLATNRMRRGGVLAAGASFERLGENGGDRFQLALHTLARRIKAINPLVNWSRFAETDGVAMMPGLGPFIQGIRAVRWPDRRLASAVNEQEGGCTTTRR